MPTDTIFEPRAASTIEARRAVPTARPDPCADPCPPRCPACGGLECLCRPRFFPGQLLTDEDLNRLSRYIVEKNKVHNRYLHGWGVACGLEVTCDPCDPHQAIVRTGYALSPCGDDIVVCKDHSVNICELIDQCQPQTQTLCDPPYERAPRDCRAGNNRWVLAICYDERPSRGVTALTGAADSNCKQPCRCGGSAGCSSCGGSGCGCGGSCGCGAQSAGPGSCGSTKSAYNSKPRKVRQPNCEPTQICEGYRFIVYPAPKDTGPTPLPGYPASATSVGPLSRMLGWMFANRARIGPLLERMLCCVGRAQDLLGAWGKNQRADSAVALLGAYQQYAEAMWAFASEFTVHRYAFVSKVDRLHDSMLEFCSSVNLSNQPPDDNHIAYVRGQLTQFDDALLEIVSECFCAALLPPCPQPVTSNCVPLAVVTLRTNDCRVIDICNWEAREILITWRTVGYWLSWLPWHCMRDTIAKFCCGDRGGSSALQWLALIMGIAVRGAYCGQPALTTYPRLGAEFMPVPPPNGAVAFGVVEGASDPLSTAPSRVVGDAAAAAQSDDLFLHLLDDFDRGRSGQAPAPAWFKLAARLTDGSLLDDVASIGGKGGVDEIRAQVVNLTEQVEKQRAQIEALTKNYG